MRQSAHTFWASCFPQHAISSGNTTFPCPHFLRQRPTPRPSDLHHRFCELMLLTFSSNTVSYILLRLNIFSAFYAGLQIFVLRKLRPATIQTAEPFHSKVHFQHWTPESQKICPLRNSSSDAAALCACTFFVAQHTQINISKPASWHATFSCRMARDGPTSGTCSCSFALIAAQYSAMF